MLITYTFPKYVIEVEETDYFWSTLLSFKDDNGSNIFSDLAKFAFTVLSLTHLNADCERIFSNINRTKTKSRNNIVTKTVYGILMGTEGIQYNIDYSHSTS